MRPSERREFESLAKCAAGDKRALLLAATPATERSEVAARYDHRPEADELDAVRQPTQSEIDDFRIRLYRAQVACNLSEDTVYRDSVARYMGGHRTSPGMDREILRAEARTEMPNDAECTAAWHDSRQLRRQYIYQRYGV